MASIPPPPPLPWKYATKTIIAPQDSILQEFHRFPELPAELQLKIWNDAIPISFVTTRTLRYREPLGEYHPAQIYFYRGNSTPASARACRQARDAFLSDTRTVRHTTNGILEIATSLFTFHPGSNVLCLFESHFYSPNNNFPVKTHLPAWLYDAAYHLAVSLDINCYLGQLKSARKSNSVIPRFDPAYLRRDDYWRNWWYPGGWEVFEKFPKLENLLMIIDGADYLDFDEICTYEDLYPLNPPEKYVCQLP